MRILSAWTTRKPITTCLRAEKGLSTGRANVELLRLFSVCLQRFSLDLRQPLTVFTDTSKRLSNVSILSESFLLVSHAYGASSASGVPEGWESDLVS
jgi:hypothetical protein